RMTPRADAKESRCNSGIGIRTVPFDPKQSDKTRPSRAAYEVQLLDDADTKPDVHCTASLYNYVAPKVMAKTPAPGGNVIDGEWFGPHNKITVNEKVVLDVDQSEIKEIKDKPLKGY